MSRIKLTIKNSTDYNTRDIRRIVLAGLKSHHIERCHVEVVYRRKGSRRLGLGQVGHRRIIQEDVEKHLPTHMRVLFPNDEPVHHSRRAGWMQLNLEREDFITTTKSCPSCKGGGSPNFDVDDLETIGGLARADYEDGYISIYVPGGHGRFICIECRGKGKVVASTTPRDMHAHARRVAGTVDHECYHLRGLHHRNFPRHAMGPNHQAPWWEDGMQLRRVSPEPKVTVDLGDRVELIERREKREAHMRAMLAKAETRLKRAETIAKKWRVRVKRSTAATEFLKAARKSAGSSGQ